MRVQEFDRSELKQLHKPAWDSSKEDNGQVTIVGGSSLFHGAPLLSLKTTSRIVDMVFFASPEPSMGAVAELLKSELYSFIWVPWDEVEEYIKKADVVLIGPGLMRYSSEIPSPKSEIRNGNLDKEGEKTKRITERLLSKFPDKRWVIDAGSLQVMNPEWIPENAILTPNAKEFELLFNVKCQTSNVKSKAKQYSCTIVAKGVETFVCSPEKYVLVKGGNPGMTKGGTGDVLAGLTTALYAKNDSFLAASSASFIVKAAADELYKKVGTNFNADDLADMIPKTFKKFKK